MSPDDVLAEFLKSHPLGRFSVYTQLQVETLWSLTDEIKQMLDESIQHGQFASDQAPNLNLIYGRFWLWVLGAYETTRTMSEYKGCFSERHNSEVSAFKARISILRMPFAKLQFKGTGKQPIQGEASIAGIDIDAKDLAFTVGSETFSMRSLMKEFARFTSDVQPADVLHDLRDTHPRSG